MPPTGNFHKRDEEVGDKVIGERIVKEAEVVERELRQEEELTSILPSNVY